MKTKKELDELSFAAGKALCAYRNAVEENLKESGREHKVIGDDEDEEGIVLKLRDDDAVNTARVDKVRWNKSLNYAEFHCSSWNYKKADDWTPVYWVSEEINYIYENIEW